MTALNTRYQSVRGDGVLQAVLERLLGLGEVDKVRQRDITLPASRIAGYPFSDAEQADGFHAALKLAEEAGALRLEWRKHYEGHELARIRLSDIRRLADFMGVEYLPDRVNEVFGQLDTKDVPDWCKECLAQIQVAWRKGKSAYGLALTDVERLKPILQAVRVLTATPLMQTLDYRQFGARYLNDSKLTKAIERPLAALFRHCWGTRDLSDRDVMQKLNVVPLAHPVLMCGPMTVGTADSSVSVDVSPYLGVPDSWLQGVKVTEAPAYVLTIENLSSFNEYTQSIADGGIVLYTGGFPTSAFQAFYGNLVKQLQAPVYHWGDTDPHGFMILKTLQQQVPEYCVKPHLMDRPDGAPYSAVKLKELARIAPVNSKVDGLLERVIVRGTGCVEQEEVAAVSPHIENL